MNLRKLYDSGRVRRFHALSDYANDVSQNLAEHQWGVALFVMVLCSRSGTLPSAQLMMHAILHDAEEKLTGDIPAPAKWRYAALEKGLREAESDARAELGLSYLPELTTEEELILKWADGLELAAYCWNRKANRAYGEVLLNIVRYLERDLKPLGAGLQILVELLQEVPIEEFGL